MAFARETGFGALGERGVAAAGALPADVVYAGISLRGDARARARADAPGRWGALFISACLPFTEFGDAWPAGVPVQVHGKDADEFFDEDLVAARALVDVDRRRRALPVPRRGASASPTRRFRRTTRLRPGSSSSACSHFSNAHDVRDQASRRVRRGMRSPRSSKRTTAFRRLLVHRLPPRKADRTTRQSTASESSSACEQGTTHAALVFDGDDCVGWCQFGPPRAPAYQEP